MIRIALFLVIGLAFAACNKPGSKPQSSVSSNVVLGSYQSNVKALVAIRTYNHYNQRERDGIGFYVAHNLVVANFSLIQGAFRVKISPLGTDDYTDVEGYRAFDMKRNLVVMQVFRKNTAPLNVAISSAVDDLVYALFREKGKLFTRKYHVQSSVVCDSLTVFPVLSGAKAGEVVFKFNHQPMGVVQTRVLNGQNTAVVLPLSEVAHLLKHQKDLAPIFDLSRKSNKVYISYTKVKALRLVTTMGNVDIKLYNETPEYRDNYIKLASDGYYDSLLVHRVIKGFLIQTGAADTKFAKHDDVVGWEGPGYTLPLVIMPNLYHKRGAVAASKLPADRNPHNRCDGSQFYIVSGRVFSDEELDDLEKKNKIRFTPEQRQVYTTIGGAPYLDGEYTVFGEVIAGMDVVDRIAQVETYNVDRPVKDIRLKSVEIVRN
jgi:cyclophilin family peptidyl-prolyl cis-trans isomerase